MFPVREFINKTGEFIHKIKITIQFGRSKITSITDQCLKGKSIITQTSGKLFFFFIQTIGKGALKN